jgi:hypothetical protein
METQEASPYGHVFQDMLLGPSRSEISGSDPSGFIEELLIVVFVCVTNLLPSITFIPNVSLSEIKCYSYSEQVERKDLYHENREG